MLDNERGFTLIELILVMALTAIIGVSVTLSSYKIEQAKFMTAVYDVQSLLEEAIVQAGITGIRTTVDIYPSNMNINSKNYVAFGDEIVCFSNNTNISTSYGSDKKVTAVFSPRFGHGTIPTIWFENTKTKQTLKMTVEVGTSHVRLYDVSYTT